MTKRPLVSVIMNCFNGERFLEQAINSVRAQTYDNWEIVFWDNQSTDGSARVARSYQDHRIKYFLAPTHTFLYEARNGAIKHASGDLIAFLDVDDLWDAKKLEKQVPLFDDVEVGLACSNFWIQNDSRGTKRRAFRRSIPAGWVLDELLKYPFVGLLTLVARRTALASLGPRPCNPNYHIIGDHDLVVRLALTWKLATVQQPLAISRLHGNNETARHFERHMDELDEWCREIQAVPAVRQSPNVRFLTAHQTYLKAMHQVLASDRTAASRLFEELPWGRLKMRLMVALYAPPSVVRWLKA